MRISQVLDPDTTGIIHPLCWELSHHLTDALKLLRLRDSAFDQAALLEGEPLISRIALLLAARFMAHPQTFDEFVKLVQIGMCQNRAENAALWRANTALFPPAVEVHISGVEEFPGGVSWRSFLEEFPGGVSWRSFLEEFPDQVQEAFIADLLAQHVEQYGVV
jgi:hypothetical protein